MSFGTGSNLRVAFTPESTYGTTPSTPTWTVMRFTSGGLMTQKATEISEEIRSDQEISDVVQVGQDVSGSYSFEMSHASFDLLIQAAMGGTWSANVINVGTTARFFTFEERLTGLATDSFRRFPGTMVNEFSLSIESRRRITGSFGLIGRSEGLSTAAVAGSTYTAANSNVMFDASSSVGTLTVGALSPQPRIQRLNFSINRGLRTRPVLASNFTIEPGYGQAEITGELSAYFESNALYQEVLNHATAAITCTIGHTTNEKYTIFLPRVRFLDGRVENGSNTSDVVVTIPFRATRDGTEGTSMRITRAVA